MKASRLRKLASHASEGLYLTCYMLRTSVPPLPHALQPQLHSSLHTSAVMCVVAWLGVLVSVRMCMWW
eukprot:scaffold121252_cov36-Tisochrysis_lutea.AAC.5